ncbi:MAG TPA: HVA1 family protein [Spirillospora sp.]
MGTKDAGDGGAGDRNTRDRNGRGGNGRDRDEPAVGDEVAWSSHGSTAEGRVEKKITDRREEAGRTVAASPEEPQYAVRSEKSGKKAVHKASALRRERKGSMTGGKGGDVDEEAVAAFEDAVNMTARELERWLETDESRSVGQKDGGGESTGHASGRRIVELLRANRADLTADDYAHMRKVAGYVRRHLAQRPSGDVARTPWRYSLMNWGHDPLK